MVARIGAFDVRIGARETARRLVAVFDIVGSPITFLASLWLKVVRRAGIQRQPVSRWIFSVVGIYPLRDHYYEPLIRPDSLRNPLDDERNLPGLDLNESVQLELLSEFVWADELLEIPRDATDRREFYYNNEFFQSGDAEVLYSMIRRFRPSRVVEIGSGQSTLLAAAAIAANAREDEAYTCTHTCIEPYEVPWLEDVGVDVLRTRVEDVGLDLFRSLERDDVLFIDSSHVIRPQGDVLFEYLEVLPTLRPGVIIHVHDIFTPRDYPHEWVVDLRRMWNEQYLLEAFLTNNPDFEVLAALNFLKHRHPAALSTACPILAEEIEAREPGSIWFRRR